MPSLTFKKALLKAYRIVASPRVIRQDRIVVRDERDTCSNPVFLVGLHRSGTTLVRQIVDSHSSIACPPETFFLKGLANALEEKLFLNGVKGMGFGREEAVIALRQCADFLYETYRQSKGKSRWADKTPGYLMLLPFIEEMYGPECQYVMIYRHPLDVTESLLRKGWDFMSYHEDPFKNVLMYVRDGLERQEQFEASHAGRWHRLFYEELMSDKETELRAMFEFLGEQWEPEVIDYGRFPHDYGLGDPEALLLKGYRPNIGSWRGWKNDRIEKALEILGPQMDRLGYSIES